MYKSFFKNVIDVGVSLVMLILLAPLIIATYVMLKVVNRGDAFFFQQRPGLNGHPFYIIKFKTMRDLRDANGKQLPDKDRITSVGRIVRKLSIDELPQLVNVLRGDMSLIGPRPLLMDYLPLYNDVQKRRNDVKPGITGWAQINGRNAISWNTKFSYDIWYVENQSFALDMRIIFLTAMKVIKGSDVNNAVDVPMPRFNGKN